MNLTQIELKMYSVTTPKVIHTGVEVKTTDLQERI